MADNELTTTVAGNLRVGDFTLTPTGLQVEGVPSFEEWQNAFSFVRRANSGILFWLGDLLAFGESRYGEKYAQAMDATGFDYQTCATAKWVCSKVPFSSRKENLSFGHHSAVASLEQPAQEAWLGKAQAEGMSRADLSDQVRAYKLRNGLGKPYDVQEDLAKFVELRDRLCGNWTRDEDREAVRGFFRRLAEEV